MKNYFGHNFNLANSHLCKILPQVVTIEPPFHCEVQH